MAFSARNIALLLVMVALAGSAHAHFEPDGSVPDEDSTTATGDPNANIGEEGPEPGSPAAEEEEARANNPDADAEPSDTADPDADPLTPVFPEPVATPVPGTEDPAGTEGTNATVPGSTRAVTTTAVVLGGTTANASVTTTAALVGGTTANASVTTVPSSSSTLSTVSSATNVTTTTVSATTTEDEGSACFPADATVQLRSGAVIPMSTLSIGDEVLASPGVYSRVFMFTHREQIGAHPFVVLKTASGASVSASAGHYLHVGGVLAAARSVRMGDSLSLADGSVSAVVDVESRVAEGLYNPQTLHGDIVVNGVVSSTYTDAVAPPLAHGLLAPFRAVYAALGATTSAFDSGADALAAVAPGGGSAVF